MLMFQGSSYFEGVFVLSGDIVPSKHSCKAIIIITDPTSFLDRFVVVQINDVRFL